MTTNVAVALIVIAIALAAAIFLPKILNYLSNVHPEDVVSDQTHPETSAMQELRQTISKVSLLWTATERWSLLRQLNYASDLKESNYAAEFDKDDSIFNSVMREYGFEDRKKINALTLIYDDYGDPFTVINPFPPKEIHA